MDNVIAVNPGESHCLFLKTDNSLWITGNNRHGQLGDGTNLLKVTAFKIADEVRLVSSGYEFSLFLKKDGTVWGAGDNRYGALGDGSNQSTTIFKRVY